MRPASPRRAIVRSRGRLAALAVAALSVPLGSAPHAAPAERDSSGSSPSFYRPTLSVTGLISSAVLLDRQERGHLVDGLEVLAVRDDADHAVSADLARCFGAHGSPLAEFAELGREIRTGPERAGRVASWLLARDFRGGRLLPTQAAGPMRGGLDVSRSDALPQDRALDARAFAAELRRLLASYRSLDVAEFLIAAIDVRREAALATSEPPAKEPGMRSGSRWAS